MGDKEKRMWMFLTNAGYEKFKDCQEKGKINIEPCKGCTGWLSATENRQGSYGGLGIMVAQQQADNRRA